MKLSALKSHRQTSSWCSQTWREHGLTKGDMKRRCQFQTLCLQTCRTFTLGIWPCRAQVPNSWNGAALGDSLPSATWTKVQNSKALKLCFCSPQHPTATLYVVPALYCFLECLFFFKLALPSPVRWKKKSYTSLLGAQNRLTGALQDTTVEG